jgi:hypothetical protein
MSPLLTHRRTRRRARSRRLVVLVCLLIVAAVLIGGLTQVGSQSGPFDAGINRSFATQGAVLATESNATATSLRRLMTNMPQRDRQTLDADLDDLVGQATAEATRAGVLAADGGIQGQFASVFADREGAVQEVRSAVDGLLGLHPLAVAGAPVAGGSTLRVPTLLSSTQATNRIAAAGRLLIGSDRIYRQVRRALARMAGHARLPSSKWVTAANSWQIGSVATQVDLVAASPKLLVTHQLVLSAVGISPPALPSPTGAATPGLSMISPTKSVTINVVLSNAGSVDESRASVTLTLAPVPGTPGAATSPAAATRRTALGAGRSVSLAPASFPVKPGTSYQLTVAVAIPAGPIDATGTSVSQVLQIAPST